MADVSVLSDDELKSIAGIQDMSDDELRKIAGDDFSVLEKIASDDKERAENVVEGTKEGLKRSGQGLKQIGLDAKSGIKRVGKFIEGGSMEGFDPEAEAREYTAKIMKERLAFEESKAGKSTVGKVSSFIAENLPAMAVPGGMAGKIGTRMLTGGAAGLGIAGTQFVPEGGSRAMQAIGGGAVSSLFPGATTAIGRITDKGIGLAKKYTDPLAGKVTPDIAKYLTGREITPDMKTRIETARGLGVTLTPAEAGNNPILAKRQGALGRTDKGAEELLDFQVKRSIKEKEAIDGLLKDIGDDTPGQMGVREAARKIIKSQKDAYKTAADPLYKKAYQHKVSEETFNKLKDDPVIMDTWNRMQKDPKAQKYIRDLEPNSVAVIDTIKKKIYGEIKSLRNAGGKGTLDDQSLNDSYYAIKDALVKETRIAEKITKPDDKSSYELALQLYAPEASAANSLKKSELGRLANLDDKSLKKVAGMIFDRTETDPRQFKYMRDILSKKDPQDWNRLVRGEIERRMDKLGPDQRRSGSEFYKKILKADEDFRMFDDALKGNPTAQKKLRAMREAFKYMIGKQDIKGAAMKSETFLSSAREVVAKVGLVAREILGGKKDKAMVDFITNPKWDEEFIKIMKVNDKAERLSRIGALLGKISASSVESDGE